MSWREVQNAHREGMLAAQRQLQKMGASYEEPIDVFGEIERCPLWLLFEPLDKLYGIYIREGQAAGVNVHSGHPVALQRFTAAHELGHHVLGHALSIDSADSIMGNSQSLKEHAAQSFAAHFLMPLQLINRLLRRIGLDHTAEGLTPVQAYQLSIMADTSYRAMVGQLVTLGKITRVQAAEWRKLRPVNLKAELGAGVAPQNPRAQLWRINEEHAGSTVYLYGEDEVHVALRENPSTGLTWTAHVQDGPVELVDSWIGSPTTEEESQVVGNAGLRHLRLRAGQPGKAMVTADLARPQAPDRIYEIFSVEVVVQRWPSGETRVGLAERQQLAWVEAAA